MINFNPMDLRTEELKFAQILYDYVQVDDDRIALLMDQAGIEAIFHAQLVGQLVEYNLIKKAKGGAYSVESNNLKVVIEYNSNGVPLKRAAIVGSLLPLVVVIPAGVYGIAKALGLTDDAGTSLLILFASVAWMVWVINILQSLMLPHIRAKFWGEHRSDNRKR